MFELFTGQRPWKGSKPAQIINSVVQHQKRPVFPPTVPRQIVELATKCWAQEPKHRPAFSDVLRNVTDLIKLEEKSSLLTSSLTVRNLTAG